MVSKKADPKDTMPQIRAFGKPSGSRNETVESCLKYPGEVPTTPPSIKKYRSAYTDEPGKTVKHFGRYDDKIPDYIFGKINVKNDSAKDLVNPKIQTFVEAYEEKKGESIYLSSKTEQLGTTCEKNPPPKHLLDDPNFRFGIKNEIHSEDFLKSCVPDETEEQHQMYVKTHGDLYPGEQLKRNYNWSKIGIDPDSYRFGKVIPKEPLGAKGALVPDNTKKNGFNTEKAIVSKQLQEFNETTKDVLGHSKYHKLNMQTVNEGIVFGIKNKYDDWGALECIKGDYSEAEQQPDKDLGKSLRPGWRNISDDPERSFGTPSVRFDIAPPPARSIADHKNYGQDPPAQRVIFPSKFGNMGITEDDFHRYYKKKDLLEIMLMAEIIQSEEEFEKIFDFAKEKFAKEIEDVKKEYILVSRILKGEVEDGMSIDIFRKACNLFSM